MSVAELAQPEQHLQGEVSVVWPPKVDVFGLEVSPTTYEEATETIIAAASWHSPAVVSCHAVHALVTFSGDRELREKANTFEMITPDGQPVRWALNLLHGTRLRDRVYGPQLTLRVCRAAAEAGVSIYLYGGTPEVLQKLESNLCRQFPGLQIAGSESPPFRALTEEEDRAVVERINGSGAGIVFIGLGCPKQDLFAHDHRDRVNAVQICVGAAFDFHAGVKQTAPPWMQRLALEWLFRLCEEPRRLWRRYLVTNSIYLMKLAASLLNVPRVLRQRAATRKQAILPRG
jgi:N-acetylglucosaminyldiphosphoundecaprenol N-acetyl-beta-D-mannosaminyltransferase